LRCAGRKERGGRRRLRGCRLGRNRSANFSILNYCRFCGVRFNLNISRRVCGNFGCLLLIAELIVATTQSGNEFLPGGIGNDFLGRVDISREILVENLRRGLKELLRGGVGGGCAGAEELLALRVIEGPVGASFGGREVVECSKVGYIDECTYQGLRNG